MSIYLDGLSKPACERDLTNFPTTAAEEPRKSSQDSVPEFIKTEETLSLNGEFVSRRNIPMLCFSLSTSPWLVFAFSQLYSFIASIHSPRFITSCDLFSLNHVNCVICPLLYRSKNDDSYLVTIAREQTQSAIGLRL